MAPVLAAQREWRIKAFLDFTRGGSEDIFSHQMRAVCRMNLPQLLYGMGNRAFEAWMQPLCDNVSQLQEYEYDANSFVPFYLSFPFAGMFGRKGEQIKRISHFMDLALGYDNPWDESGEQFLSEYRPDAPEPSVILAPRLGAEYMMVLPKEDLPEGKKEPALLMMRRKKHIPLTLDDAVWMHFFFPEAMTFDMRLLGSSTKDGNTATLRMGEGEEFTLSTEHPDEMREESIYLHTPYCLQRVTLSKKGSKKSEITKG